jgi:hypothetical protein
MTEIIDYRLKDLGNVRQGFRNPDRFATPCGLLMTPKLILKKYDMHFAEYPDEIRVEGMERFLSKEIEKGKVSPRIGLGFAIFSKDMINVVRWDDKYPIVAVNNLYEFLDMDKEYLKPAKLDVDNSGAYCVWELGIMEHEKKAWMKYLNSKFTEKDKMNYILNFAQGRLR